MLENLNIEKILEDDNEMSKCREELINRLRTMNAKVYSNSECQGELKLVKTKLLKQIDDHVQAEITRLGSIKKMEIKKNLEQCLETIESSLKQSTEQGNRIKNQLEEEIKQYQDITTQSKIGQRHTQSADNEDFFDDYDGDALMINESINEFSENVTEKRVHLLREVFKKVQQIETEGNKFLHEDFNEKLNSLQFVKCAANLDEMCLGHLKSSFTDLGLINHKSFELETPLAENLNFEKGKECLIKFYCPYFKEADDKFNLNLHVELADPTERAVKLVLKERISSDSTKRHFLLYFNPNTTGIYQLTVKFKGLNVLKSPLHFVVLPPALQNGSSASYQEQNDQNLNDTFSRLQNLQIQPDENKLINLTQSSSFEKNFSSVISVGRGRLLKMKDLNKPKESKLQQMNNNILGSMSQKRKSPNYQPDFNNNEIVDITLEVEDDSIIQESQSKLQRANAMDTEQLSNFFQKPQQLTQMGVCILSNHLKKYAQPKGSLLSQQIPPLKAQFMQKFTGFSFPIGVRVCLKRNWLIACDCGNHAVKIFDRNNANLLHTISGDNSSQFSFKRPSAVLINYENENEIFIKDDKEILVFDLSQNFQFVRKFGFKILQKPYGLTFNTDGQLVVVDANNRNPQIHIFNKNTGELISSSAYQPAMQQYSTSLMLNKLYYNTKVDLIPFENSKIRFIDCHRDYIYASDLGRSIVFKTTLDGRTQKAFGVYGRGFGQLNEPSGIHVDYDGKAVLVGDSKNNRLQIYDDEGNYKCDLEFDEKIVRPSDIHIDSEGFLYVTCFIQHTIKKYKFI